MNAYIYRFEETEKGTLGALVLERDDGNGLMRLAAGCTMELPWKDNQQEVSCIPPGAYTAKRVNSPKFGDTFEVTGVPGRSHVLFHAGNTTADTHGCILVGRSWGWLWTDKRAVLNSGETFKAFLDLTAHVDEFTLHIVDETQVKGI